MGQSSVGLYSVGWFSFCGVSLGLAYVVWVSEGWFNVGWLFVGWISGLA